MHVAALCWGGPEAGGAQQQAQLDPSLCDSSLLLRVTHPLKAGGELSSSTAGLASCQQLNSLGTTS